MREEKVCLTTTIGTVTYSMIYYFVLTTIRNDGRTLADGSVWQISPSSNLVEFEDTCRNRAWSGLFRV